MIPDENDLVFNAISAAVKAAKANERERAEADLARLRAKWQERLDTNDPTWFGYGVARNLIREFLDDLTKENRP